MLKTFTMVRMQPGIERDEFYDRWCAHTRDYDLRDHPEISLNRLVLFDEPPAGQSAEFVGIAENHWPDRAALDDAVRWYATPEGIEHNRDLEAFMDIANSPTFIVDYEVEVSEARGIDWKSGRGHG
jgi:hypothetical protein